MKKSSSPALLAHYLKDLSLELSQPPLKNPKKGEQELQFNLSVHHKPGAGDAPDDVLLATRLVVWHTPTQTPILVADHAYLGMFHNEKEKNGALSKEALQSCAAVLYEKAMESLKQHLEAVGHTPPLPKTLENMEMAKNT
ncbi:MAG: hypothetical protein COY40_06290 [Alphaproteobacteria bacterium CG_4_10_14_0_8_um_filter_53_9]|nr:MAG: hypothetical protein COY40_06290 [Alphaproteobacteria bacterium CG_4_10_14_0_8_um_filter_53_9]